MDRHQRGALGFRQRSRLIAALVVLSALAVICAVGIGVALHGRAETLDSLEHWQARLESEAADPTGFDSPKSRIRRLEAELDAVPERLFAMGSVFILSAVLVVLGYRALRTRGPTS